VPIHETIALECTERLRKHLLRDAAKAPLQLCITMRSLTERENHEHCPLTRDSIQYLLRGAFWIHDVVRHEGTFRCRLPIIWHAELSCDRVTRW